MLLGIGLALPAAAMNVVFFLVDDLGYMDVGFNNPEGFYETPRLDALARGSMRRATRRSTRASCTWGYRDPIRWSAGGLIP
jgi:arylsulfatase A-like enzyme